MSPATKHRSKKRSQKLVGGNSTSSNSDTEDNDNRKSRPVEDLESSSDDDKTSGNSSDDDGDDNDDHELLAAAAAWADKEDHRTPKANHDDVEPSPSNSLMTFSTHITQLPYDTNELDLRRLLAEHGCAVSSIRLVYDRDEHGRKTVFRGVAFVDLSNSTSYEKALSLNRKSSIRGRKLNIRPTRSKQELADIVSRTRELVQEKIKIQKEKGEGDTQPASSTDAKARKEMDKKEKDKKKKKSKKEKVKVAKAESKKAAKHPKAALSKGNKDEKEADRRLTKKERNRRAAIIMAKKRRKMT